MRRFVFFAFVTTGLAAMGCSSGDAPDASSDDVVTKRCPATINASLGELDAYSFAEIEERRGIELDASDRDLLRDPIKRIEADIYRFDTALVLDGATNAQCTYRRATPDAQNVTAKFYTAHGKNVLRIDANEGDARELSFYMTVKSYSKESLTLAYPSAAIFFRAPHPEAAFQPFDVGRASEVAVSVGPAAPATPLTDDALEAALKEALVGAIFVSEGDSEFDVFRAPIRPDEKVDAATVKAKFNGMPHTDEDGTQLRDLAGQDEGKFATWFEGDMVGDPTGDEEDQKYAAAMRSVHVLMSSALTDLKVVYVASSSLEKSHDVGWVQIFIVGRSRSGTLFAVHTGAAWT
jgi:hypothetical protein